MKTVVFQSGIRIFGSEPKVFFINHLKGYSLAIVQGCTDDLLVS